MKDMKFVVEYAVFNVGDDVAKDVTIEVYIYVCACVSLNVFTMNRTVTASPFVIPQDSWPEEKATITAGSFPIIVSGDQQLECF